MKRRETVFNSSTSYDNTQESQGIEFSGRINATDNLKLSAHYAYTDAEYGSYFDTLTSTTLTGKTPVNVPDHIMSAWVTYDNIFDSTV